MELLPGPGAGARCGGSGPSPWDGLPRPPPFPGLRPQGAAHRCAAAAEEARAGSDGGTALSGPPQGSSPPETAGEQPCGSCFESVFLRFWFSQCVGGTCFFGCSLCSPRRFFSRFSLWLGFHGCTRPRPSVDVSALPSLVSTLLPAFCSTC